ncbi:psf-1 [Pristionchus pacificus]|uniref:DNA replication complex GINS protein PSF1 n=1 Tax=Pristionchus pacificus TaxID=54126 RepID=A0A2A6CAM2_PRIPA|nr:psf-1 [Pristionchus pacificus]|eukprot:PDM75071.1 psf-1 [Pristionchus pacificus]
MSNLNNQPPGNLAIQLVQQLKRNPDMIPPFHHELMKLCTNKVNELYQQNYQDLMTMRSSTAGDSEDLTAVVQTRQTTINFVRRCCLAYVHERMKRVKALRWKFGQIPPNIKQNLTESELEFFNEYANCLAEFQTDLSDEAPVDIAENMHPPQNRFVEVRVLQDYGEFETSRGDNLLLKKNNIVNTLLFFISISTHKFVPQLELRMPTKDVAPLIRQGILEYCG